MYIELNHLLWISLILLGSVYWWGAYGIKQLALQATKSYCEKMDVQMLDQSIELARISFSRDPQGRVRLTRFFRFEFASLGDERYQGVITMMGKQCINIELEPHRF